MAKVDIIIPAFNAAHFLPFALDSVVAQTYQDWRILLIDDGSTDGTAELAADYAQQLGGKLRYIYQKNKGLPAARNTAIDHATAEFAALLDADDVWLPCRLEESVKAFAGRPELGLVYGFVDRIDPEGRFVDEFTRRNKHGEGWVAPYIYRLMLDLPCPTITFRLSCVKDVGNFDESLRSTEDRDLWLRIARRYQVALAPRLIAHYRLSPQAMSANAGRMLAAQLQFIEKHFGEAGCGWISRRIALSVAYRQYAESLVERSGDLAAARSSALRALRCYPFQMRTIKAVTKLLSTAAANRARRKSTNSAV